MMEGFDPLANLNKEVDEFEEFVDDFASKMNEIVSGRTVPISLPSSCKDEINLVSEITKSSDISPAAEPKVELPVEDEVVKISSVKAGGRIDYSEWNQLKEDEEDKDHLNLPKPTTQSIKSKPATLNLTVPPHQKKFLERVEELRKSGNVAFKASEFEMARSLYTDAIQTCLEPRKSILESKANSAFSFLDKLVKPVSVSVPATIYINRALCHIKLLNYDHGLEDCDAALNLEPGNVKALYRKYQCFRGLNQFSNAVATLQKCIGLTEDSQENQSLVSLPVLKSCLEQVTILAKDKEKGSSLMTSNKDLQEFMAPLLEQLKSADHNSKVLAQTQLYLMFATTPTSLHVFRGEFPSKTWSMLLVASCLECPENVRALAEHVCDVIDSLCSIDKIQNDSAVVLDTVLPFLFANETLRGAIAEKGKNPTLGHLLEKCLANSKDMSLRTKSSILSWISFLLQSKNFAKVHQVSTLEQAIAFAIPNIHNIEQVAVNFFFRLSLSGEMMVQNSFKSSISSNLIFEALKIIAVKKLSPSLAVDELSTIYNLLLGNSVDSSHLSADFISFLCKGGRDAMPIKILAKLLSKCDRESVQIIVDELDWRNGMELLQGATDFTEESIGDWSQVLAGVLKCDAHAYCTLFESASSILVHVLKKTIKSPNGCIRVIGNTALALTEFASLDSFRDRLIQFGAMEIVIDHLRVAKGKTVQRNLAICCAKLCKNAKGLEVARSRQVIPLIASFQI